MTLKIYDTLSRVKRDFIPLDPNNVRMYVCGPTVYDYAHIGNARPVVVFDVLSRLLRTLYPKVTYARNITDVDDKINARAKMSGEDINTITKRTTEIFHQDMLALGALPPNIEPRATDHIKEMIIMIENLINKRNAYEKDGHVLFSVPSMPDYGKLSKLDKREIVAGARVEIAPYKRDSQDFVLWKPSEGDLPGWESPWGRGRPGWHIECSAMSYKHLGESFDIHGGGLDLIFPHHENEIAQSKCAHGPKTFAKYWMHNGYLMSEGEKMSKSLGNFYTVNDLLKEFPGEAIRLTLLKSHYRKPIDFSKAGLREAKIELDRFYNILRRHAAVNNIKSDTPAGVISQLEDDLNTPGAISALHQCLNTLKNSEGGQIPSAKSGLLAAGQLLGLLGQDPEDWFKWQPGAAVGVGLSDIDIDELIVERAKARANKDFSTSDRIRDQLTDNDIILEDTKDGTIWRRS
jgi:cysteinyl-tRNA synthetase